MAIQRALLLIADIGGYTRFMKVHRVNLAHAQDVVSQLLEAVIDASGPFKVAKLEGDAVFMYAPISGDSPDFARFAAQVGQIWQAFAETQQRLNIDRTCTCDGCVQTDKLKLKFVSHLGEVAFQKVKRYQELAGVDVILVHRLLKNDVPLSEYVLMTEPVLEQLSPNLRGFARGLDQDLEGLGQTRLHYIDLGQMAKITLPELKPSLWRQIWLRIVMNARALPYLLGFKKPCEGFQHLDPSIGGLLPAAPASAPELAEKA